MLVRARIGTWAKMSKDEHIGGELGANAKININHAPWLRDTAAFSDPWRSA